MWMIERCDGARLAFESFAAAVVDRELVGQHFNGNDPIKPRVACLVYLTHAAGPNQPEDLVSFKSRPAPSRRATRSSLPHGLAD
jgi:hypothetical protein